MSKTTPVLTGPTSIRGEAKKLVVKVPDITTRTWTTLEQIQSVFTEQELVQIVHRYCDSQDHAKNYRQNVKERIQAMKDKLAELGEEF